MTLCRFLATFVLICYAQFCFCKSVVHAHNKTVFTSNKKRRSRIKIKKKGAVTTAKKAKNLIENTSNQKISKENEKDGDDTFFSHLIKLDIPEKFRLPKIVVGNPNAPKKLIIYFSYTCPHCRDFHMNEFPKFKQKYVDTGKVSVEFRNYIDDQGAYEAAQIIRCVCKDSVDKYKELSELVLRKQEEWLHSNDPANFLIKIFTNGGINESVAQSCLKRTDIGAGLMLEQKRAMNDLHLATAPSFVNGKGEKHEGTMSYDKLVQFVFGPTL